MRIDERRLGIALGEAVHLGGRAVGVNDHVEFGSFVQDSPPARTVVGKLADVSDAFAEPGKSMLAAKVSHFFDALLRPIAVDGNAGREPPRVHPKHLKKFAVAGRLLVGGRRLRRLAGHQHGPTDVEAVEIADGSLAGQTGRRPAEGEPPVQAGHVYVAVEHQRQSRQIQHVCVPQGTGAGRRDSGRVGTRRVQASYSRERFPAMSTGPFHLPLIGFAFSRL
jgi:hypothetical protein